MNVIWKALKIVIAGYAGIKWLIQYSTYVDSWMYQDDLEQYFKMHFEPDTAHILASIIHFLTPWACLLCLYYPLHCYLKWIGWYCHSAGKDKTPDKIPL